MDKIELLNQDLVYKNNLDIRKTKNITNSLLVAQKFEKRHDHILRDIENIVKNNAPKIGEVKLYIQKKEYKDNKGQKRPYYEMDRDFFTLLVMGFTGEKAMNFKFDYIQKFNQMEHELLRNRETRQIGKTVRFDYTNWIKFVNGNDTSDFIKWSYKIYTDLVYKKAFNGKTAKQKRIELGLKEKDNLREFLTNEENIKVQYWEKYIRDLAYSNNWHKLSSKECYNKVKECLKNSLIK